MSRFKHIFFDQEQIQAQVRHLARLITADYAHGPAVELVGLMNGALVFMADLIRHLDFELSTQTMRVKSYQGQLQGDPQMKVDFEPQDKRILVIDDILDSGQTYNWVKAELLKQGAREVKSCILLDKGLAGFEPDYCGFKCPDAWVIGYGMDLDGKYRNLPFIAELPEEMR